MTWSSSNYSKRSKHDKIWAQTSFKSPQEAQLEKKAQTYVFYGKTKRTQLISTKHLTNERRNANGQPTEIGEPFCWFWRRFGQTLKRSSSLSDLHGLMEAVTENVNVTTDGKIVCILGWGCSTQQGVQKEKKIWNKPKRKKKNFSLVANSHMYECRYALDNTMHNQYSFRLITSLGLSQLHVPPPLLFFFLTSRSNISLSII